MWDVGSIDVEMIKEYPLSIKWDIDNYFQRRSKDDAYYQSPKFNFARSTWRLRLYPNGNSSDDTVGDVKLYLEKLHSSIESHGVSFMMGIKNGDDTVYISEHFTDILEGRNAFCGTSKIATRSQLFRDRKRLMHQNRLRVFIENLVLTQNLDSDDDKQTSTSTDDESLEYELLSRRENKEDANHLDENEKNDPPPSDAEGVELVIKNLKDLFLNEEECDITFKVENREFRAHLVVLVARSPVFASMFRHNMSEKNTGVVNIPDCGADAFKELLLYLYSGTVVHSSADITFDLYEASVKYDLEYLRRKCVHFMKEDMSIDTFCEIMRISLKHNEKKLISVAIDFFTQHIKAILPTVKWQTFLTENPIAANELLMKAMANK